MLTASTRANKFIIIDAASISTLFDPEYTIANTDNPNSYLYRLGFEGTVAEVRITNRLVGI
jgi:hypothetical protein